VQHGVPQGSVLGPLMFLIYIYDLSKSVSHEPSPILFADDTSFHIANHCKDKFKFNTNKIFNEINKWICSNLLTLNYEKTYFLQFSTKTDYKINMQVSFCDRKIATAQSLKFLGLTIDTTLTWKHHISELTTTLYKACYNNSNIYLLQLGCHLVAVVILHAIRLIKPFMSLDVLRNT